MIGIMQVTNNLDTLRDLKVEMNAGYLTIANQLTIGFVEDTGCCLVCRNKFIYWLKRTLCKTYKQLEEIKL